MDTYISKNTSQTEQIASAIAGNLTGGEVIAFRGDLGVGKTCFTRGIAKGLGFDGTVNSPTFALINEYIGGRLPIYHFDMYRISSWDELYSSGYFEYLETGGVIVAEWSENIENALPDSAIYIEIEKIDENSRKITVFTKKELK